MERNMEMERNRTRSQGASDASQLRLLSRMDDFKVASDSTDVRGWEVIARDGREIGKVDHLVVDPAAREVRYLGVDLRDGLSRTDRAGDHVLVPVEGARLGEKDNQEDKVYLDRSSREIGALPTYEEGSIRRLLDRAEGDGLERQAPAPTGVVVIEEILIPLSRERVGERSH